jgi:hypothetical protein
VPRWVGRASPRLARREIDTFLRSRTSRRNGIVDRLTPIPTRRPERHIGCLDPEGTNPVRAFAIRRVRDLGTVGSPQRPKHLGPIEGEARDRVIWIRSDASD